MASGQELNRYSSDYSAIAQNRFTGLVATIRASTDKPFGIYPVCLKEGGCLKLKELNLLSKFDLMYVSLKLEKPDLARDHEDKWKHKFDEDLEEHFVISGPRGIRRVLWEATKTMSTLMHGETF